MAHQKSLKLTAFLMASTLSSMSYGAGFAIIEQSVTGLGRAFAGSAAVAEDASTIFFNPAGLTYLSNSELAAGLNLIRPKSDFSNRGSNAPALGGALLSGDGDDAGELGIVPNLYYAHRLNDSMVAGIGVNAPFGLVTDYSDSWVGRYHGIRSDLKTININPSFAFKANEKLSLGAGISLQYIDLQLTQAVDFGTICASVPLAACAGPQSNDGKVNLEADDWSWGYNLGVIFQATEATRLALAYRSKISHTLTGNGTITQVSTGTIVADGNIDGQVALPESASFAIHHQINDKWAVMGDASWTRWSRFKELAINSDGTLPSSSKPENWENTMRYGLGLSYDHNDKWAFRAGVAYDETPISDEFRTPRIPGEDRTWVAVGATYKYSEHITVDAGYTHIFVSDPKINDVDANGYTLTGEYDASVDILGVQMRWLFL